MGSLLAAVPSLRTVVDAFRAEADQIESVFYSCTGLNTVDQYRILYAPAEDGCLLSLWDAWNRFVRNLLLTSCAGTVEGLSGNTYNPGVPRQENAAIAHINASRQGTVIKSTRGEPQWYSAVAIADFVQVLTLTNGNSVVGAITSTTVQLGSFSIPNPLEEIRIVRNFVAHKSDVTLTDMRTYAPPSLSNLRDHVRSKRYGVDLFSDWKEGCLAIAQAAAQ